MFEVLVPKLNNNDQSYTLLDWLVRDGQSVRRGDPLVELETSKAVSELVAEQDGVVQRLLMTKAECRHGDVIAWLFATDQDRRHALATHVPQVAAEQEEGDSLVITDAARARAEALGVGLDLLRGLGKKVIRSADVERLASGAPTRPLPRAQRAVAAVVAQSHQTIPAAQAVIKVDVAAAVRATRELSRRAGVLIGLPELLINVVAGLRDRFDLFFATTVDAGTVRPADAAHIGVTVDVGTGLFVPVVRDAARRPLVELAETLLDFRAKAMDHTFSDSDLAGMNLMLSLHNDPDLVLAAPLIFPGTTCVVCLAGTLQELALTEDGAVTVRQVVNIGVTYDHRVINGRDAVRFLQAIKAALEYPEEEAM